MEKKFDCTNYNGDGCGRIGEKGFNRLDAKDRHLCTETRLMNQPSHALHDHDCEERRYEKRIKKLSDHFHLECLHGSISPSPGCGRYDVKENLPLIQVQARED
jgi:hypothetical protein